MIHQAAFSELEFNIKESTPGLFPASKGRWYGEQLTLWIKHTNETF